jgi:putative ABC transport system permease protein
MLLRLAWRELIRSWRFGVFFIFNLSLGLTGFVALQAFNSALTAEIKANAKSILSADLAVSARRELTDEEVAKMRSVLPPGTEEGKNYEFFAMLSSAKGSRLVMVKAIDKAYPFYGELELESKKIIRFGDEKEILKAPVAWIYPELRAQLGLQPGDDFQLGQLKLKIDDVISKDVTQTFRAASLAPRIFINRDLLQASGLIQYGSTYSMAYLFKLPATANMAELRENLYQQLLDPQISVDTPESAGEDSGRQLGYLSDYLGLVAIVALFMSALGAAYIYRLFLASRMKEIAILRTLGLQSVQAVGVYIIQASLLGLIASIPALVLTQAVLPLLQGLLSSFTPFNLTPYISGETVVICILMAVLGSFFVSLPFLVKIFDLKAAKLFSEEKFAIGESKLRVWPFIPGIFLFYFLAVHQSHSWKIGSMFVGSFLVVLLILVGVGYLTVRAATSFHQVRTWYIRHSFISLSRRAGASLAVFVALGLGALLINILPQLKNSLQAEFQVKEGSKIPSLFMFDIQDEQMQGVQDTLKLKNIETLNVSALVRARILKVNGIDYERKIEEQGFKTREEEREARFRNRGVNLSYRTELSTSETIVEGVPFTGDFKEGQGPAELSVEQKFAERMNLKIGDLIAFDVQGIEVQGKIVNLRKVNWTSFQPNFFILFQNGVLNEAPKTFVAAIPTLPEAERLQVQNDIAQKYGNISVVDVVRTVDDVLKTAEKMSWSLELMAALTLVTGYIVLFSIVRSQMKLRRWELNMLKILGASWKEVASFILTEFTFLAFISSFIGAFLSVGVSYGLNRYLFEGSFDFSLKTPLLSVVLITALSVLISFLASRDIVKESALGILREDK